VAQVSYCPDTNDDANLSDQSRARATATVSREAIDIDTNDGLTF